jgi:hypothetical protein
VRFLVAQVFNLCLFNRIGRIGLAQGWVYNMVTREGKKRDHATRQRGRRFMLPVACSLLSSLVKKPPGRASPAIPQADVIYTYNNISAKVK